MLKHTDRRCDTCTSIHTEWWNPQKFHSASHGTLL